MGLFLIEGLRFVGRFHVDVLGVESVVNRTCHDLFTLACKFCFDTLFDGPRVPSVADTVEQVIRSNISVREAAGCDMMEHGLF